MLKYPDISELEGKQIASEICKFAKSNLVQVNFEFAYFAGAALNSIQVSEMASPQYGKDFPILRIFRVQEICGRYENEIDAGKPRLNLIIISMFCFLADYLEQELRWMFEKQSSLPSS